MSSGNPYLSPEAKSHQSGTMLRLSIMMFLQFFVWGGWYVSMTGFINRSGMEGVTGAAYTVGPLAAIIAPFFLGMIADRFFSSERVLGVLHLLGGLFLIAAPMVARPLESGESPYLHPFILMLLLHMLCYMPTLGLTTSLSFHNLENQERQFPIVRVLGTIGWIVGNIAVSLLPDKDRSASQFYMAGGAGLLLGLFSFALPHTPPPLRNKTPTIGQILGTDSLQLFKSPAYAVFIVCSFLICIPLAGYYNQARNFVESSGVLINESATFTMSLGQMSEVFFMLIMPLLFARVGVKWMLLIGMGAWVLRYGLFAAAADEKIAWMIILGVLLHGICYDFFFVTGMIYVDKKAPPQIRNQAQGFLVLITQGLGLGIGANLFNTHVERNTIGTVKNWETIWLYPAVFAGAIMIIFFLLFWDRVQATPTPAAEAPPSPLHPKTTPESA